MKVKICGMTRTEDVHAAARLGVYALGFVFAGGPRLLALEQARDLTAAVPGGIMRVGLFMNQETQEIERILHGVELDLLQFHGAETDAWCQQFKRPYIKAVSMLGKDPEKEAGAYPGASGILFDSHAPGGRGGTGKSFDWHQRPGSEQAAWLAGGLNPGNVAEAIRLFQPWAVDVSSGVEASPGIKDRQLMESFMEQVETA